MNMQDIKALKGIHPGIFLERELQKRKLSKGRFAISIGEYPQTLGAITKGKRGMNTPLALKIEHELDIEEGFLMILQTYFDIKEIKQKDALKPHPDLKKFRKAIFWDTRFESIDWIKQKKTIIKRVFERGNEQEKKEITRFYGKQAVDQVLAGSPIN
ncbi:MAG: plasmid maintenance system antidote protein [Chitinophagaceae bacterium]|nr:MAG: plasmid maintenance system antidote protein [Chitinophagaceae bacterium]